MENIIDSNAEYLEKVELRMRMDEFWKNRMMTWGDDEDNSDEQRELEESWPQGFIGSSEY